ncbi:phospholipase D zeta 1-like [Carex rostrata]
MASIFAGDEFKYVKLPSEPVPVCSSSHLFGLNSTGVDSIWIFDELPKAEIISVSRPDASDITPMLLSYTIEFHYKEFKWRLKKKASQVLYLHFALKRRAFIEEIHEKQEQVKEWIQNLGLVDHPPITHDDDEGDDVADAFHHSENSVKNRNVPSRAALSVIKPALGRQQSISDRAKVAMQGYLDQFFSNLDIVNSREVCQFLEVSWLSFSPEYGPKLKEGYVSVKHLRKIRTDKDARFCLCNPLSCCGKSNWQKVWAVLKPGFLAFLQDPFDTKLLDIIVFDTLPTSNGNDQSGVSLAKEIKERYPLHFGFQVSSGTRTINLRVRNSDKVKNWVGMINEAALRPPEGWCNPHRYGSFAPPRGLTDDGSHVQWFIDGEASFDAIATSIEEAKSEIFITDWWLCPELYMRRPFDSNAASRLDSLLEARAKQGVQIYVLLYKEVAWALKINSLYSKRQLLNIHENVKVLRYPDHFSTGVYYWSHHEKIVIVDNQVCYIGGLDLCFGRYDNPEHKVGDLPAHIWPGKDYYNPRESEPNSWEDTMRDELDRSKYPRMPWHDVQCALWGPPCRDVARHFVQRWNFAKRNKAPNEHGIPLLMPQYHMVIPHYLGRSNSQSKPESSDEETMPQENDSNPGNHKVFKTVNSFSSNASCPDIPLLLPQDPVGPTPDNSVNISGTNKKSPPVPLPLGKKKPQGLAMKTFVAEMGSPELDKGVVFDVGPLSGSEVRNGEEEWWEQQERGDQVASEIELGQVGPRTTCHCQIVRSVGHWSAGTSQTEESIHNAYISLIEKSEHFVYIENQFFISGLHGDEIIKNRVLEALYRRIIRAYNERRRFRVIIVLPLLPGFQGGIDDGGAASVRAIMHWQYRTICRGSSSILQNLYHKMGDKADEYISFYGLRTYGRLSDRGPLVTNQIYVHSKLMLVDDRIALIGSANINDRSLLGSRDSEIGVIIEDKEFVDSQMDGKPWKAGKFTLSLRLSLLSEHLGLRAGESSQIIDLVEDATYKEIWMATAKRNTLIYEDIFCCVPNDLIHSRSAFRQRMKEKIGHDTIDLGTKNSEIIDSNDPMKRLDSIKGHIVCFSLEFMCQEDLRPYFAETEFYAAPHVFH